ncbi:MAG: hypothetical protein MUF50_04920 [Planctomycetes bacterium]|jgi:hypothetical protein|nr:hypothetical protein [Planctomycetota bacterium]
MKKILFIMLAAVFVLSACGKSTSNPQTQATPQGQKTNNSKEEVVTINPLNITQYNAPENCQLKLNTLPAKGSVRYSSADKGLSFSAPYSKDWGNEKFRVNPYDDGKEKVSFGPLVVNPKNCNLARESYVNIVPAQSASKVLAATKEIGSDKKTISDLSVVEYIVKGDCDMPTIVVFGKKYNYEFTNACGGKLEDLEKVVETVKLLD